MKTIPFRSKVFLAATLSMLVVASGALAATRAVSITPVQGGEAISADTNSADGSGAWTDLQGPVMSESHSGDIGTGTLNLELPAGFEFNTASPVTVLVTNIGGSGSDSDNINGLASGSTIKARFFMVPSEKQSASNLAPKGVQITISSSSSGTNMDSLTWQGLEIRPTANASASGNLLRGGGAVLRGVYGFAATSPTSLGTLTEVGGTGDAMQNGGPAAMSVGTGSTLGLQILVIVSIIIVILVILWVSKRKKKN
jgi:hypothetical protein